MRALAIAAAASLLAGCATAPGPVQQIDLTGRVCAAAPDLSTAAPSGFTGKEQSADMAFSAANACVNTAKGAALYGVMRMPDSATQLAVTVSSVPVGLGLVPIRVILMDTNGAVKRDYAGDMLMFRGNQLSALFRSHPDEAYLVVEADAALVGQSVARTQESTSSAGGSTGRAYFTVYAGNDATVSYTYTQAGKITIALAPVVAPKP